MKVSAKLSLRNQVALQCRKDRHLSQEQAAEQIGINIRMLQNIESLKFKKVSEEAIRLTADFYGVDEQKIVPTALRRKSLTSCHEVISEIPDAKLLSLANSNPLAITGGSAPMEADEAKRIIDSVLNTLSFREREVLKMSTDGELTLEQIGRIFNCSPGRIRQIKLKAIRKMQHPKRANVLKSLLP